MDCLENCLVKVGHVSSDWLAHDSDLDNIRGDPRFPEIAARIADSQAPGPMPA